MTENKTPAILLISQMKEDQAFAEVVANELGAKLAVTGDIRGAMGFIAERTPFAVFTDLQGPESYAVFETEVERSIGLFSDRIRPEMMHFLSSKMLTELPFLLQGKLLGNYVFRNFQGTHEAGRHYARFLRAGMHEKAFGLEKVVGPDAKIQRIPIEKSTQKQEAVEAIRALLIAAKFKIRMANQVANAADEILMNAIFDAPADALGQQLHRRTARTAEIALTGREQVEFKICQEGDYFFFSVADNFGSLDRLKLLGAMTKEYKSTIYQPKASTAGAGLGLATVLQSGASFQFVSEKNHRTEVTVAFRRFGDYKSFRDQFRFVASHFYF